MEANAVSVLEISAKRHRLEVPLFQRQYVWNEAHQWALLWEDISPKIAEYLTERKDGPVPLLGAMVRDQKQTPTTHVDKRQGIDGQQRLTTFQNFLPALRDFCREHDGNLAEEFHELTKNRIRTSDPQDWACNVGPAQRDRDQYERANLADFVACYSAKDRPKREEDERWKSFTYEELLKRDSRAERDSLSKAVRRVVPEGTTDVNVDIAWLFITTSDFHANAREYAAALHQKVILIDGQRLAELMIDNNIGVAEEQVYRLKRIDSDYFQDDAV